MVRGIGMDYRSILLQKCSILNNRWLVQAAPSRASGFSKLVSSIREPFYSNILVQEGFYFKFCGDL